MEPDAHYKEAERLLALVRENRDRRGQAEITPAFEAFTANTLAEAQVHATLATVVWM